MSAWAGAGLNSLFAAHGLDTSIREGGVSPTSVLEMAPLIGPAKATPDATAYAIGTGLGKTQIGKRLVEAAAQTHDVDPIITIEDYFKSGAFLHPREIGHFSNTMKYILTGKGNPRNAYFTKAGQGYMVPSDPNTGYLRSLLYGEEPGTDLVKLGTAADVNVGPHAETILERGHKPEDIRVYRTVPRRVSGLSKEEIQAAENAYNEGNYTIENVTGSFPTREGFFDASGHKEINTGTGSMGQDFTDFDFTGYSNRWLKNHKPGFLRNLGMRLTDSATTPIIVRTPWDLPEAQQAKYHYMGTALPKEALEGTINYWKNIKPSNYVDLLKEIKENPTLGKVYKATIPELQHVTPEIHEEIIKNAKQFSE